MSAHRKRFASALKKWRIQRGFSTAYGFFHKSGGRKTFGISYYSYLRIESGARLPSKDVLKAILKATGGSVLDEYNELLRTYLKALVDDDALFAGVLNPRKSDATKLSRDDGADPTLDLLTAVARQRRPEIGTEAQAALVFSDPAAFWVMYYLLSTGAKRLVPELARDIELDATVVASAVEKLARLKLVELTKRGQVSSPHFKQGLEFRNALKPEQSLWIQQRVSERFARQPLNPSRGYSFRALAASEGQLKLFYNLFKDSMDKAMLLRPAEPLESGYFYTLEFRISGRKFPAD